MANVLIEKNSMIDIANAIREKLNVQENFLPADMAEAILDISDGGEGVNFPIIDLSFQDTYETFANTDESSIKRVVPIFDDNDKYIKKVRINGVKVNIEYDSDGIMTKFGNIPIEGIKDLILKSNNSKYLDYLDGNGKNAGIIIDDIILDSTLKIELDIKNTSITNQMRYIMPISQGYYAQVYINESGYYAYNFKNSASWNSTGIKPTTNVRLVLTIDLPNHKLLIGETEYNCSVYTAGLSANSPLIIGGCNSSGYASTYKIFGCKIYRNNELIRDLVPYTNNINIGLKDKITDKFYYNTENYSQNIYKIGIYE